MVKKMIAGLTPVLVVSGLMMLVWAMVSLAPPKPVAPAKPMEPAPRDDTAQVILEALRVETQSIRSDLAITRAEVDRLAQRQAALPAPPTPPVADPVPPSRPPAPVTPPKPKPAAVVVVTPSPAAVMPWMARYPAPEKRAEPDWRGFLRH